MVSSAFAPEYQGLLEGLSVNASYDEVLTAARAAELKARANLAQAQLAEAEAYRRLGHTEQAEAAWKASYRSARSAGDTGLMAWALWSGGTLARQRGRFTAARRWLALAAKLAEQGADVVARGYARAGLAETGRIQGDNAGVFELHQELLAEARERGEARHIVWALEGLAQIHRNTGAPEIALEMFTEAARISEAADDRRGHAWAQRGRADLLSLRGDVEQALRLLTDGERSCREMALSSALAYNHTMRGNVLLRAGHCADAEQTYRQALEEFREIEEPRGAALATLGLIRSLALAGRSARETERDLAELRARLAGTGLRTLIQAVDEARSEACVKN